MINKGVKAALELSKEAWYEPASYVNLIKNGYKMALMDPLFWQALGKIKNWKYFCKKCRKSVDEKEACCDGPNKIIEWQYHMFESMVVVMKNKDLDEYFDRLLNFQS